MTPAQAQIEEAKKRLRESGQTKCSCGSLPLCCDWCAVKWSELSNRSKL